MILTASDDKRSAPIGLFDSGMGGLSVFMHLKSKLPNERYIYYADTLNVPYGPRASADIQQLSLNAVDWLIATGCKLVVIACNSASAYALKLAREKYPDTPIVGLVPALKPAVLNSKSKHVAVMATQATLDGILLNTVISDYAIPAGVNVIKWFDPNLVPWIESGMASDSDTAKQLRQQLHRFATQKVDHLVLGCTHYPFFRELVTQEVERHNLGIQVVDSGDAIATRVQALLQAHDLLNSNKFTEYHSATSNFSEAVTGLSVGYVQAYKDKPNPFEAPIHLKAPDNLKPSLDLKASSGNNFASNNNLFAIHNDLKNVTDLKNTTDLTQLTFYVTDTESDLDQVSLKVQRLINS